MNNNIPFLDLVTPHRELKDELCSVFANVLSTAGFIGGPLVDQFERDFAAYSGVQHCIGVSNGTDGLRFAIIAAGIKPGDTVVTVPNTFIATTEAISQSGARPDFVDIDERTYNMDPEKLREYLEVQCYFDAGRLKNRKTGLPVTAVVPVHLYGQTVDMDPILELAERYNLVVIEDACQAHGSEYFSKKDNRWKKAGAMGVAAAFSFYPGKNLGACGEGGAITTNDGDLARKIRMLRTTARAKSTITSWKGTTDGWIRSKPAYWGSNSSISRCGPRDAAPPRPATASCWLPPTSRPLRHMSRPGPAPSTISSSCEWRIAAS
jgi:dTDP-4-amino-4,6-dideoxygalactose transaminase